MRAPSRDPSTRKERRKSSHCSPLTAQPAESAHYFVACSMSSHAFSTDVKSLLERNEFERIPGSRSRFSCMICPRKKGLRPSVTLSAIVEHCDSPGHRSARRIAKLGDHGRPNPLLLHDDVGLSGAVGLSTEIVTGSSRPDVAPCAIPEPCGIAHESEDVQDLVELHTLWNVPNDHVIEVQVNGTCEDASESLATSPPLLFKVPYGYGEDEAEDVDDGSGDIFVTVDGDYNAAAEPESSSTTHVTPSSTTYPWPSMKSFLTHALFSSASLRFSEPQKRAIREWGKAMGASDLPSLYGLKKVSDHVGELVGNPTTKVVSASGNIFYMNEVHSAIAKDYGNPLTRLAMSDYPRDGGNGMSQVQNGAKMLLELPSEISSPAVRVGGHIFFVNELLQCQDGSFFIPERFFYAATPAASYARSIPAEAPLMCEELHALGRQVSRDEFGYHVANERVIVSTTVFSTSYEQLLDVGGLTCGFHEDSLSFASKMPNPLRAKANGRMIYSVPLIVFMDDVSGNISKQWNKHHVVYISNANLPRQMLEKEFCIRFVTSSPHASPMELMAALKESIQSATETGVTAWDCKYDEEVLLCPYGLFLGGDNPMQAEECSHAGLNCNYFCRTCDPGTMRTPEATVAEIKAQISAAFVAGDKMKDGVSKSGVQDRTTTAILGSIVEMGKNLRRRAAGKPQVPEDDVRKQLEAELERVLRGKEIEDHINPLLGMADVSPSGLNVHLDTPTEVLHTVLLGVVKYFWSQTASHLEKGKAFELFHTRLQSLSAEGLNAAGLNADYICQYKGSLIGKHFKSLAQVMPFLLYDLVPAALLNGWHVIGNLVVLLWHTSIDDTEAYLADLSRTIDDFLNVTAQCSPSILISKPKFHFLVHLPFYIRRFGPAILFSTERYESFNHIFRLSSIYSNRQAPSRDSCRAFAENDIMKHVVSGGFWKDPGSKRWVRAGSAILSYVASHPELARFVGLPDTKPSRTSPGTAKLASEKGADGGKAKCPNPVNWSSTLASTACRVAPGSEKVLKGASLNLAGGDVTRIDGNVLVQIAGQQEPTPARVLEILVKFDDDVAERVASHVVVQTYKFLPSPHQTLRLPRLFLTESKAVVSPQDILCAINLQHDCFASDCKEIEKVPMLQERGKSTKTRQLIKHTDANLWLLNTYSIHNYDLIRSSVPLELHRACVERVVPEADISRVRSQAVVIMQEKKKDAVDAKTASKKGGKKAGSTKNKTGSISQTVPAISASRTTPSAPSLSVAAGASEKASVGHLEQDHKLTVVLVGFVLSGRRYLRS
ncbi:hypothetical protein NUW54_g5724 [Trametes sanguinea]|uniref:Uncharacterized protein n=1 Tax=Trametes sanguinea TaxID=158606 RepID=A0ACC1PWY4_9APHY|nr:hypothetical protein NUW54_g5724 [Trametes sanguinea]